MEKEVWSHSEGMRTTYHRVHVELGKKDRQQISGMLTKGRESARVLRRALILRQLDQGQTAAQVAVNVSVAGKTVRAIARRYEEEGLEFGLYEKPRPRPPRALDTVQSQRIIAMVCGEPPAGQARLIPSLVCGEAIIQRGRPRFKIRPAKTPQLSIKAQSGTTPCRANRIAVFSWTWRYAPASDDICSGSQMVYVPL